MYLKLAGLRPAVGLLCCDCQEVAGGVTSPRPTSLGDLRTSRTAVTPTHSGNRSESTNDTGVTIPTTARTALTHPNQRGRAPNRNVMTAVAASRTAMATLAAKPVRARLLS